MRDNQPVTAHEKVLAEGQFLVSSTDPKGIIRFANQGFVDISGYAREELLGQPHNIVRHPDMPAAAFADLWKTLGEQQSWMGVVKNRSKDGGFYWVRASVSPVFSDGRLAGYISVRRRPSREEIAAAELAYAAIRADRGGWTAWRGRLKRTSLPARLGRALAPLSRRTVLVIAFILVVAAAGAGIGLAGFRSSNDELAELVRNEMQGEANYAISIALINENWQRAMAATRPDGDIPVTLAAIQANTADLDKLMLAQRDTEMDPGEIELNQRFARIRQEWRDDVLSKALAMLNEGKRAAAAVLLVDQGAPKLQELSRIARRYVELQKQQGLASAEARARALHRDMTVSIGLVAAALAVGLGLLVTLPRVLARNMRDLREGLDSLASGRHDRAVDLDRDDEFAPVNLALAALQTRMAYEQTSSAEQRAALLRDFDASVGAVVRDLTGAVVGLKDTARDQGQTATQLAGSSQAVAASASEMSASIREIAGQATQASTLARAASDRAGASREAMAKLSRAAQEITAVAKLIADIAEQTNLLALNATIEAARAGEVGRGFAVVAGEVKSLANQTQGATGDINRKIAAVQGDTQAAAAALEELTTGIGQLNDAAHAIAAAVEEQSAVTDEIARNAEQSAASAKASGAAAQQVAAAATAIAGTDERLEKAVARFKSGSAA